jgi:hypothetical protein
MKRKDPPGVSPVGLFAKSYSYIGVGLSNVDEL